MRKYERRIRWVKGIAEELFKKFNIKKTPKKIVVMKAQPHKPAKRYGTMQYVNESEYVIKLRDRISVDGHLEKCSKIQTLTGLCNCLSEVSGCSPTDIFNEAKDMMK